LYLSFTGGPTLDRLEREFGAPLARPLYCSVDPDLYYPEAVPERWDFAYMGTYSDDRQPGLSELLITPAARWRKGRFAVAGPQYPADIRWPSNVHRIEHLPPARHRGFYAAQRFTLNLTRADMIAAGYSPSVRLFEAAACGTTIVSDRWEGLETFLEPGRLRELPDEERLAIGARGRARVLSEHTAAHRASELEGYALELLSRQTASEAR
jgi:spore maturation protein CgeB